MTRTSIHSWKDEVKVWAAPLDYASWKEQACRGRVAPEETLQAYYAASWEPADCHEFMMLNKVFVRVPKSRQVVLDEAAVNRRFALCVWRECGKLLARRMTPGARKLVCDSYDRMIKLAGIEIGGSVRE